MELFVKDLVEGDRVRALQPIGMVEQGEEGVVTGFTSWQAIIQFAKAGEKKLGDNGTRFLEKL